MIAIIFLHQYTQRGVRDADAVPSAPPSSPSERRRFPRGKDIVSVVERCFHAQAGTAAQTMVERRVVGGVYIQYEGEYEQQFFIFFFILFFRGKGTV